MYIVCRHMYVYTINIVFLFIRIRWEVWRGPSSAQAATRTPSSAMWKCSRTIVLRECPFSLSFAEIEIQEDDVVIIFARAGAGKRSPAANSHVDWRWLKWTEFTGYRRLLGPALLRPRWVLQHCRSRTSERIPLISPMLGKNRLS